MLTSGTVLCSGSTGLHFLDLPCWESRDTQSGQRRAEGREQVMTGRWKEAGHRSRELGCPGSNPSSATDKLCDRGQVN